MSRRYSRIRVDERQHPRSAITVGEVIDKWLDVVGLEDTTRQRYEGLMRLYIRPAFDERSTGKLDAELPSRSRRRSNVPNRTRRRPRRSRRS